MKDRSTRQGLHGGCYNPAAYRQPPPQVRKAIYHRCSASKALHIFASYFYNPRWIVLRFEHFVPDGDVRLVRVLPQGRIPSGTPTARYLGVRNRGATVLFPCR